MRSTWCNDFDMELASFFGGAYESALGLHAAGLEPSGHSDPSGKLPPVTARAAHKDMTLVETALKRLDPAVVRVLALWYAPRRHSQFDGLADFGEYARVALLTKTAAGIGDEWRDRAKATELAALERVGADQDATLAASERFRRPATLGEIQDGLRFVVRAKRAGSNAATIETILDEAKQLWGAAKRQYAKARSGAKDAIDDDEQKTDLALFRRRLGL